MMRHGGDFAFALVLAVGFGSLGLRCGVPSSPPVDALPACLPAGGMPPDASLCVPDGEACCAPATCQAVPGGFAGLAR